MGFVRILRSRFDMEIDMWDMGQPIEMDYMVYIGPWAQGSVLALNEDEAIERWLISKGYANRYDAIKKFGDPEWDLEEDIYAEDPAEWLSDEEFNSQLGLYRRILAEKGFLFGD